MNNTGLTEHFMSLDDKFLEKIELFLKTKREQKYDIRELNIRNQVKDISVEKFIDTKDIEMPGSKYGATAGNGNSGKTNINMNQNGWIESATDIRCLSRIYMNMFYANTDFLNMRESILKSLNDSLWNPEQGDIRDKLDSSPEVGNEISDRAGGESKKIDEIIGSNFNYKLSKISRIDIATTLRALSYYITKNVTRDVRIAYYSYHSDIATNEKNRPEWIDDTKSGAYNLPGHKLELKEINTENKDNTADSELESWELAKKYLVPVVISLTDVRYLPPSTLDKGDYESPYYKEHNVQEGRVEGTKVNTQCHLSFPITGESLMKYDPLGKDSSDTTAAKGFEIKPNLPSKSVPLLGILCIDFASQPIAHKHCARIRDFDELKKQRVLQNDQEVENSYSFMRSYLNSIWSRAITDPLIRQIAIMTEELRFSELLSRHIQ
ncbi:MAG: hypothetical protein NUW37_12305 [Planctomycetes bacterium]|nr:hypothetical protein [Planctomycetota bacterium]